MVAAVPGKVVSLAMFAAIAPPAHGLGATQENGLQGLALAGRHGLAIPMQIGRVEAYQDIGDAWSRVQPHRMAAAVPAQKSRRLEAIGSIGRWLRYA
jgi:hypothetical protein